MLYVLGEPWSVPESSHVEATLDWFLVAESRETGWPKCVAFALVEGTTLKGSMEDIAVCLARYAETTQEEV